MSRIVMNAWILCVMLILLLVLVSYISFKNEQKDKDDWRNDR